MHASMIVTFKSTLMVNGHFVVSKYSLNSSIKVMRFARFMLHSIKIYLYKTTKFLILSQVNYQVKKIKDVHLTIPIQAPSIRRYTKADIGNGYVIPQESQVYRKSEKFELFKKQNWFCWWTPEFTDKCWTRLYEYPSLSWDGPKRVSSYMQKLCNLDRDLKQTAFVLKTQKFRLVAYVITGQRNTFTTLKSSIVFSFFQCTTVSSTVYVLEDQFYARIPIFFSKRSPICRSSNT